MILHGWVVTHRDTHDDEESCKRAITDYATNATRAWINFLRLISGSRGSIGKEHWVSRGYVARRVKITIHIEDR